MECEIGNNNRVSRMLEWRCEYGKNLLCLLLPVRDCIDRLLDEPLAVDDISADDVGVVAAQALVARERDSAGRLRRGWRRCEVVRR